MKLKDEKLLKELLGIEIFVVFISCLVIATRFKALIIVFT